MGRRWLISAFTGAVSIMVLVSGCNDDTPVSAQPLPAVLAELLATPSAGGARTMGDDQFEVWICHVPMNSTAAIYGGLPLRVDLTPQGVADVVNALVPAYFDTLSHGQYRPVFTPGGDVALAADEEPQACIDSAIAGAGKDTEAVLVVADAEHGADQPGGFASGGDPCASIGDCTTATARRSVYVGASDFHPSWGDGPPMDLVEHEVGHSLGWVHSGIDAAGNYLSGLDVMSNSAAPREIDPIRRNAPATLAFNLFLAGWLPADQVVVATGDVTGKLAPSNGDGGWRLVLLDDGSGPLYSVELLTADGLNDHLPAGGIAVHEIQLVDGVLASITPMVGATPFTALLQPGEELRVGEWTLTVANDWTVSASRSPAP